MQPLPRDRAPPEHVALADHRILEQVRDYAMFLVDRNGRAASWNVGVREVLGWEKDDWLGQPMQTAFTPDDVAAGVPERELAHAADTGRADDDRWMLRKSGERFFANGSVARLDDDAGEVVGFLKVLRDATASKEAALERERLLESERSARADSERQAASLTAAIEAIPDAVYIGTAEGITRCNAPALTMLGVASLEELRRGVDELARRFRVRTQRNGPPAQAAELPYARALQGETTVLETWITNDATHEDLLIRGTAAPIVVDGRIVGVVAVNTDLTERLQLEQKRQELWQAETALYERDQEFRALVEGVRDYAIFTVDTGGLISSWHEGAALMKGYRADEAIGMPFAKLFLPDEQTAGRPRFEMDEAARTGEYKGDGRRLRKDGTTFEAAVVLTALRGPGGELLGYLKLTQDITERKHRERERDELLNQADAARTEAERANHLMGEFLATISHELRTPLGAILGWAHLLERGPPGASHLRQGLTAITRNARLQVQLIEDLLDMNRIESGQLRLDVEPVLLPSVVTAAVDAVLPLATAKGVALRTEIDAGARVVEGDPGRLQQVVSNLLSNALKFTPAGGKVTVALAQAGDAVEISVSDTGQGIEPGFLGQVFDRFKQQDAKTTRRFGGLGIGLAIVRELVELHGGKVRVESAGTNQGSVFTVTLPCAPAEEADDPSPDGPAGVEPRPGAPGRGRLDGTTVLLVDDEPDVRTMAEHVLRDAGAEVLPAAGAEEGFRLFQAHRPQVIVSDIGMPRQDGHDFLRRVRALAESEGGRTPAAAFTAYARTEDRQRARESGYQAYLVKPVEPTDLVEAVATLATRRADPAGGK